MARIDVVMPQMGESIAEGTLSRWLKKVGDAVKRDEPLFEISTDKVDAEIPAPTAGVLAEVMVTEGQTVAVQTIVARIETEQGAAVGAASAGGGAAAGNGATSAAASGGAPPKNQSTPAPSSAPHPSNAVTVASSPTPAAASAAASTLEGRLRTKSSPLVRKIAAEHGI